jgi:prophage DNA circulation protein
VISYLQGDEAVAIIDRMLTALMDGMPITGRPGSDLRKLVGALKANSAAAINNGTVGTQLQACFDTALAAGATLPNMDNVRIAMLKETPQYFIGAAMACAGVIFSLVEQTRMITAMTFASRSDVEVMLTKMSDIFDEAKLAMSNMISGTNYEYLVALSAALIQHLAATERMLPRMVSYQLPASLPALNVANLLYGDGARFDELIAENKTVHPAFMQRDLVALSE